MDIHVAPFKADHARHIADIDVPDESLKIIGSPGYLELVEKSGPGFTLWVGDEIVGCVVFIRFPWRGLADVVMFMSKSATIKHRFTVLRICRRALDVIQKNEGFVRLQANICASSRINIKFALAMGFKIESEKEAFGPDGETFLEVVRIRKGY